MLHILYNVAFVPATAVEWHQQFEMQKREREKFVVRFGTRVVFRLTGVQTMKAFSRCM